MNDKVVQLVTYIAKELVTQPEEVRISLSETEDTVLLELTVAPDDMGRVIGKQGRIAKAMRTVMRAAAIRQDAKVSVEID